jgi:hypothetical protein
MSEENMKNYVLIHEDATVEEVTAHDYRDMQKFVGGLLTGVWPGEKLEEKMTVYANDEGILLGLEYNSLASASFGQTLFGPILVGGPLDEDGETQDVLPRVREFFEFASKSLAF